MDTNPGYLQVRATVPDEMVEEYLTFLRQRVVPTVMSAPGATSARIVRLPAPEGVKGCAVIGSQYEFLNARSIEDYGKSGKAESLRAEAGGLLSRGVKLERVVGEVLSL